MSALGQSGHEGGNRLGRFNRPFYTVNGPNALQIKGVMK